MAAAGTAGTAPMSDSNSNTATTVLTVSQQVAVWCFVALLRILVGFQPHSGQDNYHGLHAAYGGDFEAQRHWMEVAWQLSIDRWYWYDLEYWGLDYPPMSAYLSWICGALSNWLVGPESVALVTSRGLEDPVHKAFMRATVLVTDLLVYGSVAWVVSRRKEQRHTVASAARFCLVMAQPAMLCIDHGHFQYNTTALGLALWSFYYMTQADFASCVIGSILFCCALSFKQMTLYFAPVVFAYLLGRCCSNKNTRTFLLRFCTLAVTVLTTFALIWWPFVVYGPTETTMLERLVHVLRRIFPLGRGLFEGKVSNLWCALSIKPIRIRQRLPLELQPLAALVLTLLLVLPSAVRLFGTGRRRGGQSDSDLYTLLWGTTSSALAFFLASFQVHEKSILLALAPASFLVFFDNNNTQFVDWFSLISIWTLWPLMVIDCLQTAYWCTIVMYCALRCLQSICLPTLSTQQSSAPPKPKRRMVERIMSTIPVLSFALMLALHVAELMVMVPLSLPDLFPVLWSLVGCGFCGWAWLVTCWHLYDSSRSTIKEKTL